MNYAQEALKGSVGTTYTFRQFGLTAPRELPDGTTYLGVSPDGWPRFHAASDQIVCRQRELRRGPAVDLLVVRRRI